MVFKGRVKMNQMNKLLPFFSFSKIICKNGFNRKQRRKIIGAKTLHSIKNDFSRLSVT